jgi:hypothetical protein
MRAKRASKVAEDREETMATTTRSRAKAASNAKHVFAPKGETPGEYVQMDAMDWQPMPEPFASGGIRWKLLHVSPESGGWTAIFDCPAGSSFGAHYHLGPGEYFLTKGRMDVRGGEQRGGDTAHAPGYGYEPCNALHEETNFPVDSEFYMTFLGPLHFVDAEGGTVAVAGWKQLQDLWQMQNAPAAAE